MYNKNRSKGKRIYVKHDIVWEKRKRQEEVGKWANRKGKMVRS